MNPIPINLPVRLSEAAAVGEMIAVELERRPLDDEARRVLAAQAGAMEFASLRPWFASLEADRGDGSMYLAADGVLCQDCPAGILLRFAQAATTVPDEFEGVQPVGRVRAAGGRCEMAIHALPFSPHAGVNIRKFNERVGGIFSPSTIEDGTTIAVGAWHPEISAPSGFRAVGAAQEQKGRPIAPSMHLSLAEEMETEEKLTERDGETPRAPGMTRISIGQLYDSGVWTAVRAGWRRTYVTGAGRVQAAPGRRGALHHVAEKLRLAAGYSQIGVDLAPLIEEDADARRRNAMTPSEVEDRFERLFDASERKWLMSEFGSPFSTGLRKLKLDAEQVKRLAVKFGAALRTAVELRAMILRQRRGQEFDLELEMDSCSTLTTPAEVYFCLRWMELRDSRARLIAPSIGFARLTPYPVAMQSTEENGVGLRDYASGRAWPELAPRVEKEFEGRPLTELGWRVGELAAVARHFGALLAIHSGSCKQAAVLDEIGHAAMGHLSFLASAEFQLQLLEVLSEKPQASTERQLYNRMAARAYEFARQGLFGEEFDVARKFMDLGRGFYLGDRTKCRTDGNVFLVRCLGALSGTRDINCPNADTRFFAEKLRELPEATLAEARARHEAFVGWLARHLC